MDYQLLHEAFGWVARVSWQAGVLAALVLATQWAFRKHLPPAWRHALWLLVLARLALPVSPQSALSIYNVARKAPDAHWATESPRLKTPAKPVAPVFAGAGIRTVMLVPVIAEPVGANDLSPSLSPIEATPSEETKGASVDSGGSVSVIPALPPVAKSSESARSAFARKLSGGLPALWLAGVVLLALRLVGQNLAFRRHLRAAMAVRCQDTLELLHTCAGAMRVARVPRLYETTAVQSPALYGVLRLRLLLPAGMLEKFSAAEMRFVFLHELGHVKRRDMVVHWLATVLQVVHWFNPVLWYAFARMRADRELACDALALSRAGSQENQSYGQTIVKLLSSLSQPNALPSLVGIIEDKREITHRIRMIAQYRRSSSWSTLAVAVFSLLAVATLTDAQSREGKTDQSQAPAQPAEQGGDDLRQTQPPAADVPRQPTGTDPSRAEEASDEPADSLASKTLLQDARLLIEMGKLNEAEKKLNDLVRQNPADPEVSHYIGVIKEARVQQETRKPASSVPRFPNNSQTGLAQQSFRVTNVLASSPILRKLNQIILEEVQYDGLPLSDVVRDLNQRSREQDPDKRGINFILNPGPEVNLADVKIRLRLNNVRLIELIDAVAKVAEAPIKYSVEPYAVVFFTSREPEAVPLFTRTYRVDPHFFLEGLRSFMERGVIPGSTNTVRKREHVLETTGLPEPADPSASPTIELLRNFFEAVGIELTSDSVIAGEKGLPRPSGKALFFNDVTGVLLVRATLAELDIVEQAIKAANVSPAQIAIEARLIEVGQQTQPLGFDWFLGNMLMSGTKPTTPTDRPASEAGDGSSEPDSKNAAAPVLGSIRAEMRSPSLTEILTDPQFRAMKRALEQQGIAHTISAPRVVTVSGRRLSAKVTAAGPVEFELRALPTVLADGRSIRMEVEFIYTPKAVADDEQEAATSEKGGTAGGGATLSLSTSAIIWDGQTMVLGPFPGRAGPPAKEGDPGEMKRVFLFLSPTIIDPAGNRVHGKSTEAPDTMGK